jgi:hypothetical protein
MHTRSGTAATQTARAARGAVGRGAVVRAAVATEEEGMAVETAGAVAVQAAETECTKTDSSCRLFGRLATWRRLPLER